jgi:hypothetical protein
MNTPKDAGRKSGYLLLEDTSTLKYMQFGLSAAPGTLDLTSLTFDALRGTTSTSTRGYDISVSVDGGGYSALAAADIAANRSSASPDNVSIDLSGGAYQDATSVDFRLSNYGGTIEVTNFAVNGTIPEPATLGLVSIVGAGLIMVRRVFII